MSAAISLVVLLVAGGISAMMVQRLKAEYRGALERRGLVLARVVAGYGLEPAILENFSSLGNVLDQIRSEEGSDIVSAEVLDRQGTTVVATDRRLVGMEHQLSPGTSDGEPELIYGEGFLDILVPVTGYSRIWGYLKIRYSTVVFIEATRQAQRQILVFSLLAVVAGIGVSVLVARTVVKPVNRLVACAQAIAKGELTRPVPVESNDEVGFLAQTLDQMRLSLRSFLSQMVRKALSFEGSLEISSLPEVLTFIRAERRSGGLVLDRSGATAVIYFRDGDVVHCALGHLAGPRAFHELFDWSHGYFKFSPKLAAPQTTITCSWEKLLAEAVRRAANPDLPSRWFPLDGSVAARINEVGESWLGFERTKLSRVEQDVFGLVDGKRGVAAIARELGLNVHRTRNALYALHTLGFVRSPEERSFDDSRDSEGAETVAFSKTAGGPGTARGLRTAKGSGTDERSGNGGGSRGIDEPGNAQVVEGEPVANVAGGAKVFRLKRRWIRP